jgi:hypothetical protein
MDDIGTVEFGDWLLFELRKAKLRSQSTNARIRLAASRRTADLQIAKKLLRESLKVQSEMIQKARALRALRALKRTDSVP